ncbi:hypothetical protein [Mycobacterium kyorinense]|uniref:hypothetical protein n=1 Tax=Mycobacterium kyorinense TaxID=487514 RepID=UPI001F266050|nr:hypothetical protein [Mycobacterium kyorinense]
MGDQFRQALDFVAGTVVRFDQVGEEVGFWAAGLDLEKPHQHWEDPFGDVGAGDDSQQVQCVLGVGGVDDHRSAHRGGDGHVFTHTGAVDGKRLAGQVDDDPAKDLQKDGLSGT